MEPKIEFELEPVDYLPPAKQQRHKFDDLLEKFVKSKNEVARVKNARKSQAQSLKAAIRRLKLHDKIWAAERSNEVYLFKTGGK